MTALAWVTPNGQLISSKLTKSPLVTDHGLTGAVNLTIDGEPGITPARYSKREVLFSMAGQCSLGSETNHVLG